jgi:hypothetical protein
MSTQSRGWIKHSQSIQRMNQALSINSEDESSTLNPSRGWTQGPWNQSRGWTQGPWNQSRGWKIKARLTYHKVKLECCRRLTLLRSPDNFENLRFVTRRQKTQPKKWPPRTKEEPPLNKSRRFRQSTQRSSTGIGDRHFEYKIAIPILAPNNRETLSRLVICTAYLLVYGKDRADTWYQSSMMMQRKPCIRLLP